MKRSFYLLVLLLALSLLACKKEDFVVKESGNVLPEYVAAYEAWLDLPPLFLPYQTQLPNYLKVAGLTPRPASDAKATLGRVLFYDKNLSADRSISCASCHKQAKAFSDNVAFSTGIAGLKGSRNAMPIANVASFSAHYSLLAAEHPLLLWDNRASTVAEQSKLAFLNDHEMGMTMEQVAGRIREQSYYPYLWNQIYGDFEVTEEKVLECLNEFVGAIGSHQSRFDEALERVSGDINFSSSDTVILTIYTGTDTTFVSGGLPGFNQSENRGRDIFVANCSKCHSPIRPFQEVFEACNGLDLVYPDQGIGQITGNPAQNGVFKAPSLRNIAFTAPYMHDGRFNTLEEVVDFYSTGVKDHPNLHPLMRHDGKIHLDLTHQEKQDLVAFLHTLSDPLTLTDKRFSNPFKK